MLDCQSLDRGFKKAGGRLVNVVVAYWTPNHLVTQFDRREAGKSSGSVLDWF